MTTPAFFPWLNGVNERNQYSSGVMIKKVMKQDKKLRMQTVFNMASWIHNTNVNVLVYLPLQLVTGKIIVLLSITWIEELKCIYRFYV